MDRLDDKTALPPAWASLSSGQPTVDVRSALARGEDPLSMLLQAAQDVASGGVLAVDAPFNPSPLRRVLAGMGFSSYGRRLSGSHWRVFFCRDGGQDWERDAEVDVGPEGALSWHEADGLHIDVRKLPPPQPMLVVLKALDTAPAGTAVVVHLERVPHLLFDELPDRGWQAVSVSEAPANVQVRLEHL